MPAGDKSLHFIAKVKECNGLFSTVRYVEDNGREHCQSLINLSITRRTMKIAAFILFLGVSTAMAQMAPDLDFDTTVAHPTYTAHHPRVAIDQSHNNVHTKDRLFKPFSEHP